MAGLDVPLNELRGGCWVGETFAADLDTASGGEAMDDDFGGTIFGFLILGVVLFVVFGWNGDGWVGKGKYAISYGVSPDVVYIHRKPYDCDWGTAPLGEKHCGYAAVVEAYNSAGRIVAGNFPKVPIIGIDLVPRDLDITRVEVRWLKVSD